MSQRACPDFRDNKLVRIEETRLVSLLLNYLQHPFIAHYEVQALDIVLLLLNNFERTV